MSSRTCCSAGERAVAGVIGFAGRDGLAAASAKRFGSFRFAGCSCRVPGALAVTLSRLPYGSDHSADCLPSLVGGPEGVKASTTSQSCELH